MKGNVFILVSFFCMLFVGCKEGSEQNTQKGELIPLAEKRFNLSDSFFSMVNLLTSFRMLATAPKNAVA